MENLVNGNFDVHIQLFAIVAALLSWRDGQGLEIRGTLNWQYVAILSETDSENFRINSGLRF